MSTPPPAVCGTLGAACCATDACNAPLRCDVANKTCVVAGDCVPHSTRTCTGVVGCGGGTETCTPDGKWSNVCVNEKPKSCPPGWTAGTQQECTRKKHVDLTMSDDRPDGYNYGRVSIGFDTYGGAVDSRISFSYGSGGCWSSDSKDAVLLFGEKFQPQEMRQCETGAPPSNCKTGGGRLGLGSWIELHKIKGWTPPLQGTCVKVANIDFTARLPMRCSW